MSSGHQSLSRFGPFATRAPASLQALADRLSEAHFHFELQGSVLSVRDSFGGRVEFQHGDDGQNDYRADVYGARRMLVVNLVTALQVYGLLAHFHFVYPSQADKLGSHRIRSAAGAQAFRVPLNSKVRS